MVGSQISPKPEPSRSSWPGLLIFGQLSTVSITPSKSSSVLNVIENDPLSATEIASDTGPVGEGNTVVSNPNTTPWVTEVGLPEFDGLALSSWEILSNKPLEV